ncbi:MAG: hypothetical protein U9R28_08685 [Pseudomonadota bacterium]|nr:hypothetical protein [Pseudomonadota bacterium]
MKTLKLLGIFSVVLFVGCSSHHFVNKPGQSHQKFVQDKVQCQSAAMGQSDSTSFEIRLITFEECMRKLGYQQQK